MIPCNFKTGGANVALEKKVVAQKDAFLVQTDLSHKPWSLMYIMDDYKLICSCHGETS